MKNLLLPQNGKLLVALLAFFVMFGMLFDPLGTFWLALAFAGILTAYRLMQLKRIGGKTTKKVVKKTKKARRGRR